MSNIHLITTCTNGKNGLSNGTLSLSKYTSGHISSEMLINSWCSAVNSAIPASASVCAVDLYKGGHWATAKAILKEYPIDLWILSAGLGLLNHKDKVLPYQATFAKGYEESIPSYSHQYVGKSFHRTWWKEINERSPFNLQHPTSITALMKRNNRDYFIICGSPDYINAIELDIINGLQHLNDSQKQLLIITSKKINVRLESFLFKSNQYMAQWLKCNMLMLNISLARYLVKEFVGSKADNLHLLSQQLTKKLENLPEREFKKGIRRSLEEVNAYILNLLIRQPGISATQALRIFRDGGNSFEEKRFRVVFKAIAESKP